MISRFIGKPPYITKSYSRTCRRQNSPILLPKFTLSLFCIKNYQIIINQHWLACKSIKLIVLLRRITKKLKYAILF